MICASVVLASLLADGYLRREGLDGPDLYVLLLLSASGGVLMAGANDLIVLFLGLEILSLAVYVLAAMHLRRITSQEAGIKYFVLGSFASAFLLYGIALTYGATGTTNLVEILDYLSNTVLFDNGLLLAGMAMLLVGLGFKVAAAPFHAWTPDVYQGAPTPVVAYMASGVKAAGFAGLIRVFYLGFQTYRVDWQPIVYALAVLTLLVGSIMAVVQTDVKRMLAYSSISHAGFILVAVQAANERGVAGDAVLPGHLHLPRGRQLRHRRRRRPHRRRPPRARRLPRPGPVPPAARAGRSRSCCSARPACPFTSGFFAKFYAISAAVDARSFPLAMVAMLAAVVAAFLYLRITVAMWMDDVDDADVPARASLPVPVGVGHRARRLPGGHPRRGPVPPRAHRPRRRRHRGPGRLPPLISPSFGQRGREGGAGRQGSDDSAVQGDGRRCGGPGGRPTAADGRHRRRPGRWPAMPDRPFGPSSSRSCSRPGTATTSRSAGTGVADCTRAPMSTALATRRWWRRGTRPSSVPSRTGRRRAGSTATTWCSATTRAGPTSTRT